MSQVRKTMKARRMRRETKRDMRVFLKKENVCDSTTQQLPVTPGIFWWPFRRQSLSKGLKG